MRMPKIMKMGHDGQACCLACGLPHHAPEPVPAYVLVFGCALRPGRGSACCAGLGAILREGVSAMLAPALPRVVGAERAMPVPAALLVRLGEPEVGRFGDRRQ